MEAMNLPQGTVHRCPSCTRIFIEPSVLQRFFDDISRAQALFDETKLLRLPTSRLCPKCLEPLCDARVRSRGANVTVCAQCEGFWMEAASLRRLDEVAEQALSTAIDRALNPELVVPEAMPKPAPTAPVPEMPRAEPASPAPAIPARVDF